jgi:peptide deformylase
VALREIELLGSDVLRTPGEEIVQVDDEVRTLIDDMFETMRAAEGIGLAAPQVGVSRRVLVVDLHDEEMPPLALVNPRVVESSRARERAEEGCLSVPGVVAVVERPSSVTVEALDRDGAPLRIEADDLLARCIQHEVDHLDGVLFLDRVGALKRDMLVRKWRKLQKAAAK